MRKRIAIDGRKFGDFGIGTTIRGLLGALAGIDQEELEFLILGTEPIRDRLPDSPHFHFVKETAPHYSIREILRVGATAERGGAELLHIPHYVTPRSTLPMVVTIHDLIHLDAPLGDLPLGGRLYARWMIRRATRKSARVVTVSHAVRAEIESRFPSAAGKVVVVPNGVEPPSTPPVPPDGREPFLLFVGNDKPHKNADALVWAFSRIRESRPEVSLVLVGSPFERFADAAGVTARGFVEERELIDLYRRAMALVQPSLMEGFGLPVAEAMSHGTPVIVSRIPALMEVAGDAAIPIDDPRETASIARTLEDVLSDRSRLDRSARLGPSIAAKYRWSTAAASLIDLWRSVLGTPASPAE